VPGRPIVYATSRRFLEVFGLAKLGDLPTLRAIEALPEAGAGEDAPAVESTPPVVEEDDDVDDDLELAALVTH